MKSITTKYTKKAAPCPLRGLPPKGGLILVKQEKHCKKSRITPPFRGEGGQKTFATFTVNGFQLFQHPKNSLIQNVSQADG
jgi:hypothetical protein